MPQERAKKRPRKEGHGRGSSSGGRAVAACLGPELKETDLINAVDEEQQVGALFAHCF